MILALLGRLMAAGSEDTSQAAVTAEPAPRPSFTPRDADTAFTAYNQAFYVVHEGKGYYKEDTTGGRNAFWTQAEEIEMILDTWERSRSPADKTLITQSMSGFELSAARKLHKEK
jgi:hypothetical protein